MLWEGNSDISVTGFSYKPLSPFHRENIKVHFLFDYFEAILSEGNDALNMFNFIIHFNCTAILGIPHGHRIPERLLPCCHLIPPHHRHMLHISSQCLSNI